MTATAEPAASAAPPHESRKEHPHAPASAAPSSAAQTSRPLVIPWSQVKAFVSMAQEALRAKAAAHEALRAEVEKSREEHEQTSEDSAFLQGQVSALLSERAAALDRVAALEREIDFLRQERTLLADQLELEGEALSGAVLARALSARLATEAAGRAEAEARAEALEEALAAVGLRMEEEEAEVGPAGGECCEAAEAPAPLAPRQSHQAVAVAPGGGKKAAAAGRTGRGREAEDENSAPL